VKSFKKITTGILGIHNSNKQMTSSDCCYYDRASLPMTQNSNRDACRYLIGPACQSPNVATGMNHRSVATMNLKHRAPLSMGLFKYATYVSYKCRSAILSLSLNRSLSPSLNSIFSKEWHPTTIMASTSWRRRPSTQ
jgi:hypothetical protein